MATDPVFNPVLLHIPDQIDTERLVVRAPRPGDGAVINASVLETLDDLRRYPASMIWAMEDQPVEKTEEYARRGAANWIIRADFPLIAFHRDTGEHVGNVGLHRFNWQTRVFEIGWWCRKRFQGQGFITEAARAMTEFAFQQLGARRVWCGRPTLRTSGAGAWPRDWDSNSRERSRASAVTQTAHREQCGSMQRHARAVRSRADQSL